MKILFIGDVVGSPGRKHLINILPALKKEQSIDFVVCNAENSAAGSGITPKIFRSLREAGCDVITSGDHTFRNKEVFGLIEEERFIRPANFSPAAKGKGHVSIDLDNGKVITVINLIGRVFMDGSESPFHCVENILNSLDTDNHIILVDFHAEATSEKIAMGHFLDGRANAVVGTHTHVQTSDGRLLPKGTAHITDLGMTGARHGVIGRKVEPVLHKFLTDMPARFEVADEDVCLEGAIVTIDDSNNTTTAIEAIRIQES